ncbi:MAG: hypothetical protein HC814_06970 [Rhodobacteraceae bacterium]|nr:hypothetical protein [Paracoccaceae bacterium]
MLAQTCDALEDAVYRVRMLPFAGACSGLERAIRDIAQAAGKNVALVVEGEDVEVDRSVLEGLKDPLLHLVRNAVDHGIEPPQQRLQSGKPIEGRVTVSAALRGGHVEVVVADDGRGFDLDSIRNCAAKRGLPIPTDDRELLQMIFKPGFSTAAIVTDLSGRGVGLDVVENQIQLLHGTVDVSFKPGAGTRFALTVPLTLTTIRCVVMEAAGQVYAIPTTHVHHLVRFDVSDLQTVGGRQMLLSGGPPMPIATLAEIVGQSAGPLSVPKADGKRKLLAAVVNSGDQQIALVVENVQSEQEILVKNLGAPCAADSSGGWCNTAGFRPCRFGPQCSSNRARGYEWRRRWQSGQPEIAAVSISKTIVSRRRFRHDSIVDKKHFGDGRLRDHCGSRWRGSLGGARQTIVRSGCQRRRHAADERIRVDASDSWVAKIPRPSCRLGNGTRHRG